ncbi:hypothetical protein BsWGS_22896 [Bradybaena similaris]
MLWAVKERAGFIRDRKEQFTKPFLLAVHAISHWVSCLPTAFYPVYNQSFPIQIFPYVMWCWLTCLTTAAYHFQRFPIISNKDFHPGHEAKIIQHCLSWSSHASLPLQPSC